ncbi:hypothetical protein BV22DRAFT_1040573 [Leucogyrophana mollusca]|uniref:Uncharacterized protein n=1 Tax=Leucogyrophana mollusca TaxID=85980 RepID=A0ACB8B293_9AGAM|nr:hypothetical protein BV22DRAFT_1040573 [Leucogyrophana mollusca]
MCAVTWYYDFFLFFPAIYALTFIPDALAIATRAVLSRLPFTMHIPRAAHHPTARTAHVPIHLSCHRSDADTKSASTSRYSYDARGGESWDSTCVGIRLKVTVRCILE